MYTTGEALKYLQAEMERRGIQRDWNREVSGVSWLRLHRLAGHLEYEEERQGTRPKYYYSQEALDTFLDALTEVTKPGRPKADFSMLTEEEKQTLSVDEIAKRAGVGRYTVYRARMTGELPPGNSLSGRPRLDFSMLTDEQRATLSDEEIVGITGIYIDTVRIARKRGDLGPRLKSGKQ